MELLAAQFSDALGRIELGEKRQRAIDAQREIRTHLEGHDLLRSWGIDTVLIGSYARQTSIYPGKDVDVFAKMQRLDTRADPQELFDAVRSVLVEKYGDRAVPQARSIKVQFSHQARDDFSADVVPAVHFGDHWAIPRRDSELWRSVEPRERWVETDPEKLTQLTSQLNSRLDVDGRGAYVPTVKLVRQLRSHHMADNKPGGFYFELISYWAFEQGLVQGGSFAELLCGCIGVAAEHLRGSVLLLDPVLNRPFEPQPTSDDRAKAASLIHGLAADAKTALLSDRCKAAVIWRRILGSNDRGHCFTLPPGCDEEGNEIKDIAAVAAVGSKEPSGFA